MLSKATAPLFNLFGSVFCCGVLILILWQVTFRPDAELSLIHI